MSPSTMSPDAHAFLQRLGAAALENKAVALAALAVAYVLAKILYALLLSPTRRVPGSLLDKAFGLRFKLTILRGNKMTFAADCNRQYGPLAEIAPGVLSCTSPEAVKVVYGSPKWRKSQFYSDFADFNGVSSLFSETHHPRAQILRRAFLPAFARANLVAMAPNIFKHINAFLAKLDEFERAGKPLEAYKWTRYLTFEVVTDVGFGGQYDMISSGELNHPFVRDFDGASSWGLFKTLFPVLTVLPEWALGKTLADWRNAEMRTLGHAQAGIAQWRERKSAGVDGHRVDILRRLIEHGDHYPAERLSEKELEAEIMEIMLAGSDTTATTITYGLYELAVNPDVQAALRRQLRAAVPDPAHLTLEQLEAVPYLDWTVKEMLRTHPTLPSLLERVVPAQGAHICGYDLPAGTVVAMSAWSMNKTPSIFPDPLAFRPERWEHATPEMTANMLTFSTGPRACVGQNLAIVQMRIHMGTILRNFSVTLHPDTTPDILRTVDNFQGKPAEDRVYLYFHRSD